MMDVPDLHEAEYTIGYMKHTCWCGTADHRKPMTFRGTPWCCGRHRSIAEGEITPNQTELEVMPLDMADELRRRG